MDEILIDGIIHPAGWTGDRLGAGEGAPWPVPVERLAVAIVAVRQTLLDRVVGRPDDRTGNALRLALYHFSVTAAAVAEVALAIEAEHETGLVLTGAPEIAWLRGQADQIPAVPTGRVRSEPLSGFRLWLGRMARAAAWSPTWKWPKALLSPDAVAVTHNDLLRSEAARSAKAIGFRHADKWLAAISTDAPAGDEATGTLCELANGVAGDVAKRIGVKPALEARVTRLLAGQLHSLLQRAWRDVRVLEHARLPDTLWSGTGGNWAARALGIEVMRRGGSVRRFDHGCGFATVLDPQGAGLIELCVSTEFVVATPELANILRKQVGRQSPASIEGGRGDPHFRRPPGPLRTQKKRPHVMYVTAAIVGLRRIWPVKACDFVYLDWQMRVARALRSLDVELTFKPHPEGLFRGRPHPLGRLGRVEARAFEEAFDDADVVLFDEPTSTTFWVAVSSNCRVVLMNAGLAEFDPHLAPLVESRVAIVPVRWDRANRPQFQLTALEAAIRDRRPIDYRPLRRLMAGDDEMRTH
jgi:hypothetical protein